MLSCGEPSGDLYAAALTRDVMARAPGTEVFGFGGDGFAAAGGELLGHFAGLSVTGLTEALRVVPRSLAMIRRLVAAARDRRPDVFVAVDFPDFNFRLMAGIRALGIPVVYYISPQLWAWRSGRMATMQRLVDRVLVIFPFEERIYREAGVPVTFVGHPIVDMARPGGTRAGIRAGLGLDPDRPLVALLPGSRTNELRLIAPDMAAALPAIAARVPGVQFVVARAPHLGDGLFAPFTSGTIRPLLVQQRTDDLLASADLALVASGTATVQAALHECPMVVVYRLSPWTYRLGHRFVKVDTYAMANLVAGSRVVPELIQDGFDAGRLADEAADLLTNRTRRDAMVDALRGVRGKLGVPGASGRAADAVIEVARRHAASC